MMLRPAAPRGYAPSGSLWLPRELARRLRREAHRRRIEELYREHYDRVLGGKPAGDWLDELLDRLDRFECAIAIGISEAKATTAGATATTAAVTTQASGSVFVVCYTFDSAATFTSITDSKSNSWSIIGSEINASNHKSRMYYVENATGGSSHTFTGTNGSASLDCSIWVIEITGALTSGSLDQSGSRSDTTSPFTLAAGLLTTQNDEALVTFVCGNSGSNPATHAESGLGASTVQDQLNNGTNSWTGASATEIKSSTGTYNPSWTESGATAAHVWFATFKAAGDAAGITNAGSLNDAAHWPENLPLKTLSGPFSMVAEAGRAMGSTKLNPTIGIIIFRRSASNLGTRIGSRQ